MVISTKFFTYQFILRLWPGLMMQQIMQQFMIDATEFGLLASCYYYGYAAMQIPVAMALDRYSPRYVVFLSALVCGIAAATLSYTENWYIALISRCCIGAGSAVGFLGTSKVVSQWFGSEQYARMIGFSFTIGLMGAIYGGKPVSIMVTSLGWYKVSIILSSVAVIIGILTYLFLRAPTIATNLTEPTTLLQIRDFKKLINSPVMWILAIANLLMVGSLEGFADVWGVPYLMTTYHIAKGEAAELISFIFLGMLVGGPVLALCAKKLGNYLVISLCGMIMAVIFAQLLWLSNSEISLLLLRCLFVIIGIMCCYQVLIFAIGCELVEAKLLGVTVAFLNCINMLGGVFFHTSIGFIMDLFWTGKMQDDLRIYSIESYSYALSVIPLCALIGASMVLLVRMIIAKRK
ncbi:MFS transporter [Candidatus Trichorickettsia mobilis]|uniref:MFS transporter n=1 Tax=Candidatus Trichorickettsia mobilis TaxID=1346319 RepID=UPI0029301646|nr:MFS transporter [Candidatus Trichorickettsia mobilis]